MEALFWISTFVFAYAYFIYPLIIHRLAKRKVSLSNDIKVESEEHPVSVVLCVYNGESSIKARLNNLFASKYPSNKINLIVVSDGSTDNTSNIVKDYQEQEKFGHQVTFVDLPKNAGKASALNSAYPFIKTDYVAFCDIRQTFCENALREMMNEFTEPSVGAVTGNLIIRNDEDNLESDPGLYWKYEKWIRDNEGKVRSLVGVTGAIYMARTELLPQILPSDAILDDMFVPLNIVKAGYNVKMANKAYAYDISSATIKEEFDRKVRTLAGNFQLMNLLPFVNSFRNPLLIQWWSHKVARLLVPYSLVGIAASSLMLEGLFYELVTYGQIVFYGYSALAYLAIKADRKLPLGNVLVNFITLNYAAFLAGWRYYTSSAQELWKKH